MAATNLSQIRKYMPKPVVMHGLPSASTVNDDSISYRVVRTKWIMLNNKTYINMIVMLYRSTHHPHLLWNKRESLLRHQQRIWRRSHQQQSQFFFASKIDHVLLRLQMVETKKNHCRCYYSNRDSTDHCCHSFGCTAHSNK